MVSESEPPIDALALRISDQVEWAPRPRKASALAAATMREADSQENWYRWMPRHMWPTV